MAIHRYKLHKVRPRIDTSVPSSLFLSHIRRNRKGETIDREKCQDIARDNEILVSRMRRIMKEDQKLSSPVQHGESRPLSLNYRVRKERNVEIRQQNKAIIKRLCASKSVYARAQLKPAHFQPHFLPRLDLGSLVAVDEESRSLPRTERPNMALDSIQQNATTVSSLSTRSVATSRVGTRLLLPARPPPRLPDDAFKPRSFDDPRVLIREAVKCQGKCVVATVKRPSVLSDLWDIEFYVPDEAATYVARLSVDAAAEWLGVDRGEFDASASPKQQEMRSLRHLRTLLRCYDLVDERRESGGTSTKVPRLTRTAGDVRQSLRESATSTACSKFVSDYCSSVLASSLQHSSLRIAPERAGTTSSLVAKPATKLQARLRKAIGRVAPEEYFRHHDLERQGALPVGLVKRIVRQDCRVSSADLPEPDLDVVLAHMEDAQQPGTVRLETLVAFVAKDVSMLISAGGKRIDEADGATVADQSVALVSETTEATATCGVKTTKSPSARARQAAGSHRRSQSFAASYAAPPSKLVPPKWSRPTAHKTRRHAEDQSSLYTVSTLTATDSVPNNAERDLAPDRPRQAPRDQGLPEQIKGTNELGKSKRPECKGVAYSPTTQRGEKFSPRPPPKTNGDDNDDPRTWPVILRRTRRIAGPTGTHLLVINVRCHPTELRVFVTAVSPCPSSGYRPAGARLDGRGLRARIERVDRARDPERGGPGRV